MQHTVLQAGAHASVAPAQRTTEEALALHLVDELVAPDNVYDAALAWANRFIDAPPAALAGVKALIDGSGHTETQVQRYGEVFARTVGG